MTYAQSNNIDRKSTELRLQSNYEMALTGFLVLLVKLMKKSQM